MGGAGGGHEDPSDWCPCAAVWATLQNGNGALEPEEMRAVLVDIGLPLGVKEQRRLCEELDRDGDHLIEIDEIKMAMHKSDILMAPYHGRQKDKVSLCKPITHLSTPIPLQLTAACIRSCWSCWARSLAARPVSTCPKQNYIYN